MISQELLINKIITVRGLKVMIDKDLAELYGVTTKQLNQQVRRNINRFPGDFMFQLTKEEKEEVVTICDHLKGLKFSSVLPYAFTDYGAVMLASVLNSERAIAVNVEIIRAFIAMREMVLTRKDIMLAIDKLEKRVTRHDKEIAAIFECLKKLIKPPRREVGFKIKE